MYYLCLKKVAILQLSAIHRLTWSDIVFVEIQVIYPIKFYI